MTEAIRLCYFISDLENLATIKAELDEIEEKVWLFEEERRKFDDCYIV